MIDFAKLVDQLYFTSSNLAKAALIKQYLSVAAPTDRGWAIAAIAGTLQLEFFKRKTIKDLITKRVDPILFDLSYDYVGEMSETVAHLWQAQDDDPIAEFEEILSLNELIAQFQSLPKKEIEPFLITLLNQLNAAQRWALIKLGTRGLRIGVSAQFVKKILAEYGQEHAVSRGISEQTAKEQYSVEELERLWHGVKPPYDSLFDWLEGNADKPDVSQSITFQPVMLSHPIDESTLDCLDIKNWTAEWKFDGIRVQLVITKKGKALFSRTGDDISHSFPDLLVSFDEDTCAGVFDGELLALQTNKEKQESKTYKIASFNQLQQRLNKKRPSKKLMNECPVGIMLYDALKIGNEDLRAHSLVVRQSKLNKWFESVNADKLMLSQTFGIDSAEEAKALRERASQQHGGYIEGLMLKRNDSLYIAGRPKNQWFKWKRDPLLIDAVMMYAQRGHGKRSSFYSDYTFGCWQGESLLPVGKAYSGFTDVELKEIDKWIRQNTVGRFGPVKEVKKELVFELAFDSVHLSKRHKSGLALRFPRVHRIRWDKPAHEADTVTNLRNLAE
ncbi:cisplatin damage response ATP-dependent DNA ligase [Glaciecola sp. KUL10]|uniref:cisplatin damage response ATP-dependent DNA ligase n=1 Tax=Glaciecola sp. (strain KUL10) TaxID=2161813 RepID=UPI000D782081|nr:cisplatin damage response ATP-dependent DNA ligase [Glaciecola sp. KUL10]GBL04995.1 ATP dependent DNA ligase [Glaciecola sp. KUL10]